MDRGRILPTRLARWWREFERSGKNHRVDPLLLAAVCDRETRGGVANGYSPKGPAGKGDNGHGHGLMQIDDRSHASFIARLMPDGSPMWADAQSNIDYGAFILATSLLAFDGDEHLACCAYNAGRQAVRVAIRQVGPDASPEARHAVADAVTTGKDYGRDVLARRAEFTPKESP